MKNPVMTIEEVAEYLKVHSQTVYKMVREGQIKAVKVGRGWRVHKETLDNYLKGGQGNDKRG